MTLTELIPSLQQLSHQDKLKAIQFLVNELAEEEENSHLLEEDKSYEVWSPYDAFAAESVLTQMLEEHSKNSK